MGGLILMYHRVAVPQVDTYDLAVHPARFAEHVEHLRRLKCVVPLGEILAPGANKIAVTFDDGYGDNATTAAPLLAAAGLPATYFITTGRIGAVDFWWDRLARALLAEHPLPSGIDVTVGGDKLWLALNDAQARAASLRFLHRRLAMAPSCELEPFLRELLEQLAVPLVSDSENVAMTAEQLLALAEAPLADFGAHTRTHVRLSAQTKAVQREEIFGSIADLTTALGRPVSYFAYPFGSTNSVGQHAPRLVREAGCALACTTEPGTVTARTDPYRLPRINVGNWTAHEFTEMINDRSAMRGGWRWD